MRRLIYSMSVSLDGYINGPDGSFDWSVPDEELHQFHNDQVRELDCHLLGRRLYETMVYWETTGDDPSEGPVHNEFASIWQALPKLVFSSTLEEVQGNTRLASDDVVSEVHRLKEEPGRDIAVGGAALAADCIRAGLVDDFRLFVLPVAVGGGTPFFPTGLDTPLRLRLIETREFKSPATYLRYEPAGS
jgi:dihydrofolate reductase